MLILNTQLQVPGKSEIKTLLIVAVGLLVLGVLLNLLGISPPAIVLGGVMGVVGAHAGMAWGVTFPDFLESRAIFWRKVGLMVLAILLTSPIAAGILYSLIAIGAVS